MCCLWILCLDVLSMDYVSRYIGVLCCLWMMCLGVLSVDIQLEKGLVIVSTILPAVQIQEIIEDSGRKAVLFGVKGTEGQCNVHYGVIAFIQLHFMLCPFLHRE